MSLGLARNCRWFRLAGFVTLLTGFATPGIDLVENHLMPSPAEVTHIEELLSYQGTPSPCNACLFHRLLSQALVPDENVSTVSSKDIFRAARSIFGLPPAVFPACVTRGPPPPCV
jgi:hypothetical protein